MFDMNISRTLSLWLALIHVNLAIAVSGSSAWRQSIVSQTTFSSAEHASINVKQAPYDNGLFTPLEDLNVLSESRYTTLRHPLYPNHNVRIKKTRFCEATVQFVFAGSSFM